MNIPQNTELLPGMADNQIQTFYRRKLGHWVRTMSQLFHSF